MKQTKITKIGNKRIFATVAFGLLINSIDAATVIYDNGPADRISGGLMTLSGFPLDNFSIAADGAISGVTFFASGDLWSGDITYHIYRSKVSTVTGRQLIDRNNRVDGMWQNPVIVSTNKPGVFGTQMRISFELEEFFDVEADRKYWIGLDAGRAAQSGGDLVWLGTSKPGDSLSADSPTGTMDNVNADNAFFLTGEIIPEPSTTWLLLLGLSLPVRRQR